MNSPSPIASIPVSSNSLSPDTTPAISINGRRIGAGEPVYIVAEMSANHAQDYAQAARIVHAAKVCGADAVKLQTYTPDSLTIDCAGPCFQIGAGSLWAGKTLYGLYGEAATPYAWHKPLQELARDLEIDLFSSPFDHDAVDFLQSLDMPAYKIASFEIVDLPLIRRAARTGKPLIMSTGMASEEEIALALETARDAGCEDIALLKCTSAYPAPPEAMHLRGLARLAGAFGVPIGLSDHSMGVAVPVAAVALGACIIEKHLTLSRDLPGPDSAFSLEPHEFGQMVEAVRTVEKALGQAQLGRSAQEEASLVFRRSLFVVEDVRAGERLTPRSVRIIRPGHGLAPRHLDEVLGRAAVADIRRGTPLQWDMMSNEGKRE